MLRTLVVSALALALATPAEAIPAFARRYNLTCMTCHDPVPKLASFGETFLARGYRLSDEDTTGVTTLGDPLLWLQQTLPVAVRMDAYLCAYGGRTIGTDFATPMIAKFLSGGSISPSVSYCFYLLLAEGGVTGPIEDAWVAFRRPFGLPATVTVGQFQTADPVWKREIRLPVENYQIPSQQIGEGAADGVFDGDAPKTGVLWAMRRIGPLRIGAMGYYGAQGVSRSGTIVRNRTWMAGPAVQLSRGNLEFNGQYVSRGDTDPTFDGAIRDAKTNGGFAEAIWWPLGHSGRLIVTGLYNRITSDALCAQYETGPLNASWLARRNLRLVAEGTWDFLTDHPRAALGLVTAF